MHAKSLIVSDSFNPMDCSSPGSSVLGILQARILEWVPIPSPGDLPDPGIEPWSLMSPALADGFFTASTTWEAHYSAYHNDMCHRNLNCKIKIVADFFPQICIFFLRCDILLLCTYARYCCLYYYHYFKILMFN